MTNEELCNMAVTAMDHSYSPYSGYRVGAALETSDGLTFTGCNIENASFSPTVCAERTAVFKAISEGHTKFRAIAIAGGKNGKITGIFPPCGVCRQVLAEFCSSDFLILLVKPDGYETHTLGEFLPFGFSPDHVS